jgi:hypothetical protein
MPWRSIRAMTLTNAPLIRSSWLLPEPQEMESGPDCGTGPCPYHQRNQHQRITLRTRPNKKPCHLITLLLFGICCFCIPITPKRLCIRKKQAKRHPTTPFQASSRACVRVCVRAFGKEGNRWFGNNKVCNNRVNPPFTQNLSLWMLITSDHCDVVLRQ